MVGGNVVVVVVVVLVVDDVLVVVVELVVVVVTAAALTSVSSPLCTWNAVHADSTITSVVARAKRDRIACRVRLVGSNE